MSSRGGGKRPTKLVNLSGDDGPSSSPVNIPPESSSRGRGVAKSAPGVRRGGGYGSSLVEPVLDEADVMISSSVNSDTSAMERRKEAAKGGLGGYNVQNYGAAEQSDPYGYGESDRASELEQSAEIAEDYVKIAQRHKREDHGTTYVP